MRATGEGRGRAAAAVAVTAALLLASGCGGGDADGIAAEKAADAEILNVAIGQELTLIEAYRAGLPLLRRPEARRLFRRLIAQEHEHVDGFTKAMRGLGGEIEAEPEEVDDAGLKREREFLLFAYELTGIELTHFLDDVPQLQTGSPRSFAASIAASQAQHLVVIRRLLGADLAESVPEAFDTGEVPPPGEASPPGEG